MPSQLPLSTTEEFLRAYKSGVVGQRNKNRDARSGAIHDLFAGIGALIFGRLQARDQGIFRAIYFNFADGDDLARIATDKLKDPLIEATKGTGKAYITRASAAAGADTVWKGTRFSLVAPSIGGRKTYVASADKVVGATDLSAFVNIEAQDTGRGVVVDTLNASDLVRVIEDPLLDNTWQLERLFCADGTEKESPEVGRARIRSDRLNSRPGYIRAIRDACIAAGAQQIALFGSDFTSINPNGTETIGGLDEDGYGDCGLNYVAVADASFLTTNALLRACQVAMDAAGIAGTALQVVGMQPVLVRWSITVRLWDSPGKFAAAQKAVDTRNAVIQYFGARENPFYFRTGALRASILDAVPDVQSIEATLSYVDGITTHTSDPAIVDMLQHFPLNRYYVTPGTIVTRVTGP